MATTRTHSTTLRGAERRERDSVAVLDDDLVWRRVLCRALSREGYAVIAGTASERAPSAVAGRGPAIVVLVERLGGSDAAVACRRVADRGESAIVVLTNAAKPEDRARLLDAGADDVIELACRPCELAARLRALLRRIRADGAPRLRLDDLEVDPLSREVRRGERRLALTAREFRILLLLLRRPRRVVDRATIVGEVWPGDNGSSNSIGVCVHHLRKKLHGPGERPLLRTARLRGYVLSDA